jgi:hypothetical protein
MNLQSRMRENLFNESCGHLKFNRCLKKPVYNSFPWPGSATARQRAAVAAKAQAVLDARALFLDWGARASRPQRSASSPNATSRADSSGETPDDAAGPVALPGKTATLANLYDPLSMPPALARAHAELDRAVDLCYRPEKFESDRQRVEFLFALYEKLTAPLLPAAKTKRARRNQ